MRQHLFTFLSGSAAWAVLSAAAYALPEPLPMGSRFYLWFYRFSHALLANLDRLKGPSGGK